MFLGLKPREAVLALLGLLTGAVLFVIVWITSSAWKITAGDFFMAALLIGAVCLADRYPIQIRLSIKISIISIPLFLIIVSLPLPLAVTSAGLSVLISDFLARRQRGLILTDLIVDTARWMVIALIGSGIYSLPVWAGFHHILPLIVTALVVFILDTITFTLGAALSLREPFINLFRSALAEGALAEGIQYLLGVFGALIAYEEHWALILLLIPAVMTYFGFKNIKEMRHSTREMLEKMADAIDLRDSYTGGHSRRVAYYAGLMIRQMHIDGPEAELIITSARLHDIGKVGVPDYVLQKPGRLTDDEMELMRQHCSRGADILSHYPDFSRGADMIYSHHENWDGTGYPKKQKGHQIPFGARVIAIADAFDAMTSDRPYRKTFTPAEAADELRRGQGKQWDAELVEVFLLSIRDQLEKTSLADGQIQLISVE